MKTALRVLLALVLVSTLTGCRCVGQARSNRCLFCRPTAQCLQRQVRPPSQWCWGNCQVENLNEEPPGYMTLEQS